AALVCSAPAIGCGARIATLPGILGAEAYPPAMVLATGAIGEDCGTSILFVPLRRASLADAVARAIASVPEATLLTDVQVDASAFVTGVYTRGGVRRRHPAVDGVRADGHLEGSGVLSGHRGARRRHVDGADGRRACGAHSRRAAAARRRARLARAHGQPRPAVAPASRRATAPRH